MDAIDEVRLRLSALESHLAILELDLTHANPNGLDMRLATIEGMLATLEFRAHDAEMRAHVSASQAAALHDALLRLTNQVAIVAATLGTAIHALKRGDSSASDAALTDALTSQDRLGAMINEIAGRPR